MLLTISHTSQYKYDLPVSYGVQRLRLRPATSAAQTVHEWHLHVEGAEAEVSYLDAFGNHTDLLRITRNAMEVVVTATGQVETKSTDGIFGNGQGFAPLWIYERQTPLTRAGAKVGDLIAALPSNAEPLPLLHRLCEAIHERLAYQPGTTDVATDAEAALAVGTGVCQDHAHVFIAAARHLRMPARYVSGYLHMDGISEQTASHAWAEAFVQGLGWVGFDAANAICPDERYVRLGCGLDYRDAAPITGIRAGGAEEALAVTLNVEQ